MKIGKHFAAFFLSLCFLHAQQPDHASNANDLARFLAGLSPQSDPALMELSRDPAWQKHADSFNNWWNYRPLPQIQKVTTWAHEELQPFSSSSAPAIYFFSGADFLYLQMLFPNATTYVMCAKESAGRVPTLNGIPLQNLPAALNNLQKSIQTLLNFSYFITEDMKKDLTDTPLSGITPLLYVLMARTGKTIINVQPVSLSADGNVITGNPADPRGIRIDFTSSANGPTQTLYYFSDDLSNSGLKANSSILRFCSRLGQGAGFLKSASYLLHMEEFSHVREYLLTNCQVIVQDPSGIPLRYFSPQTWSLRFYGHYVGTLKIFDKYYQKDLADQYAMSNPKPLEFGMGYHYQAKESSIMVAFRKGKSE